MIEKMEKEVTELLLKNAFEEYENERFDAIIEKYKDTEPEYSEEHKRRMKKLFKQEKHNFSCKKFAKRAAMIILAIFISGAMALQVEAVKIRLENWYYEITGEALHFGDEIEYLPGYSETKTPRYVLSDEFVEKYGLSFTQRFKEYIIETEYKNINDKYVWIVQIIGVRSTQIDVENAAVRKQNFNNREITMVYRKEDISLYFEDNDNRICIHTNMGDEKIEEILNNLVIKS